MRLTLPKRKYCLLHNFFCVCVIGRSIAGLNANCKRSCNDVVGATKKVCLETGQRVWDKVSEKSHEQNAVPGGIDASAVTTNHKKMDTKLCSKYPELFEPHTFAPKDLLALLKNLENEISVCEVNLRDENDKRKKYKVSGFDLNSLRC